MKSEPAIEHRPKPAPSPPGTAQLRRQLSELYAEHQQFIWRNLLRMGVPADRVDDALHDAFLVVAERLSQFEGRSSIRTWLFSIAYNVARGVRRDLGRTIAREVSTEADSVSPRSSPETLSDAARQLHHLLNGLDEDKRVAFIMSELEGMTAQEIATVLHVKVPTIYSRIRVAREQLTVALTELNAEGTR